FSASSLTDSLRSVVRLRRAVLTHTKTVTQLSTESGDKAGKNMGAKDQEQEEGHGAGVFP
ncbi:hypothetical protein, partial [Escherichia coli]|uniref:hypothetical protein n=1 Tax=Escherichia coli TaxID=562 RepID=UPI00194FE688